MQVEKAIERKTIRIDALNMGNTFMYKQNYYMLIQNESNFEGCLATHIGPLDTGILEEFMYDIKVTPITFKLVEVPNEN